MRKPVIISRLNSRRVLAAHYGVMLGTTRWLNGSGCLCAVGGNELVVVFFFCIYSIVVSGKDIVYLVHIHI